MQYVSMLSFSTAMPDSKRVTLTIELSLARQLLLNNTVGGWKRGFLNHTMHGDDRGVDRIPLRR